MVKFINWEEEFNKRFLGNEKLDLLIPVNASEIRQFIHDILMDYYEKAWKYDQLCKGNESENKGQVESSTNLKENNKKEI